MRVPVAIVLFVASCACAAEPPTHYLTLVNRTHDSVVTASAAAAGSDAFVPLALARPLRGGGGSATVSVAGEGCRYDVQLQYRGKRAQLYRNVDVCGHRGLRLRPTPRGAADGEAPMLANAPDSLRD
ncbi:hypothetical protein [Chiayiivirga flava]|uniref:Uncharacterized protein n=1 Tax=Chiayiivirga flava TaxID=659595 RepID=A0A7W8G1R1_9GAMM|nr:hypothetical protein [Chiayiivirga flava]MBB5209664.1 hypothetical protein [Chiayiivirga flava]